MHSRRQRDARRDSTRLPPARGSQYQKVNKEAGNEWFTIESNKTGTRWTGKVWYVHEMRKYEFDLEFELPVAYPQVSARIPQRAARA